MSELINFNLVSPERKLASLDALSVIIPGAEGDMTALPNHAPFLTAIRPGVLTVNKVDGMEEFIVTGGFAEISDSGTTVLAEHSIPRLEVDKDFLDTLLKDAETEAETAKDERRSLADLRLNDVRTLIDLIN